MSEAGPSRPKFGELAVAAGFVLLTFATGMGMFWVNRPFYANTRFFYDDPGVNLYLADLLANGGMLYRDAGYPYGPVPIALYAFVASVFGNSCITYIVFQSIIASCNAGLLYFVMRGVGVDLRRACFAVLIAIPFLITPGCILGNYLTACYIQMERCYLTLLPVMFLLAKGRTSRSAAIVGLYLAGHQFLKFGGCFFAGFVLVMLDLVSVLARKEGHSGIMASAKFWLGTAGWFAVGEGLRWVVAFGYLPSQAAWDVVLPAYAGKAYGHMPAYTWSDVLEPISRTVASWFVPCVGIVFFLSRTISIRRLTNADFALLTFISFYAVGSFKYFGHYHMYLQYAWMLVAAAGVHCRAGWMAVALAAASWVAHVKVEYFHKRFTGEVPSIKMFNGDTIYLRSTETDLPNILEAASMARFGKPEMPGRLIVMPVGAGHHFYFRTRPFSRDLWNIPAYVRPWSEPDLLQAVDELSAVIGPAPDPLKTLDDIYPPAVANAIRERMKGSKPIPLTALLSLVIVPRN